MDLLDPFRGAVWGSWLPEAYELLVFGMALIHLLEAPLGSGKSAMRFQEANTVLFLIVLQQLSVQK